MGGSGAEDLATKPASGAKQDTGNTSVASIDTKTPPLGQALAAASVPVVLPAAQVTTLTPPAAITGFALEAGHLAAIDTSTAKIPSQGQALAAASLPVVLTAIQQAALTPPAAITGFALDATVAKDASLATIDTDIKATQPRDVTDRAARLLGIISAANLDVALSTLATAARQDTIIDALRSAQGFVPIEVPEFVGAP